MTVYSFKIKLLILIDLHIPAITRTDKNRNRIEKLPKKKKPTITSITKEIKEKLRNPNIFYLTGTKSFSRKVFLTSAFYLVNMSTA